MSAFSWARPGVEVVCISSWGGRVAWYLPKRAVAYTISDVDHWHQSGSVLALAEIAAQPCRHFFPASCFRPLIRKSQSEDVALFKRIASEQPVEGV